MKMRDCGIKQKYIHLLIAAVVGFLTLWLIPLSNGLTEKGLRFIAILLSTIVLLCVEKDTDWVCVLALILMGAAGVMTPKEVFADSFGNWVSSIVIAAMLLTYALAESGVAEYVSKWILSIRLISGHPYVYLMCVVLAIYVLTLLTSAYMAIFVLLPLCCAGLERIGLGRKDGLFRANMFIILWLSAPAELLVPFGKVMPILLLSYAEGVGCSVSAAEYLRVSIPANICLVIAAFAVIRFGIKPDKEAFMRYNVREIRRELDSKPLTRQGKCALAGVLLCFVLLILPSCSFLPSISSYLNTWGTIISYWIPVLLLALIHVDGKPVLQMKMAAKNVSWGLILFVSTISLFSGCPVREELGVLPWLTALVSPLTGIMSPQVLLIICILITALLTNVISNVVTIALSITAFLPFFMNSFTAGTFPWNPALVTVLIGMVANISFLTPTAATSAALLYGSYLDLKSSSVCNVAMLVLSVLLLLAMVPLL